MFAVAAVAVHDVRRTALCDINMNVGQSMRMVFGVGRESSTITSTWID